MSSNLKLSAKKVELNGDFLENTKDMPKVSIVVIEKNEVQCIEKCLHSLLNQTYTNFEIIVVDGNSTDGTKELISSRYREYLLCGKIKLLVELGLGFAHARNVGVRNSTGEIIAFTGGNEIAHPEWIEKLVSNFKSDEIGGVYGRMMVTNEGDGSLLKRFCAFKRNKDFSKVASEKGIFGRGTNMAFRKHVIEEVGYFNENLCDADDTELAWRVSRRYKILYEPSAIVFHQKGEWQNWRSFLKYLYRPVKGHAQAVRKNGLLQYYPRVTLLYIAPILYTLLLLASLMVGDILLITLLLVIPALSLLGICVMDAVRYHDGVALLGLFVYPIQLLVGSAALLAGFVSYGKYR